MAVELSPELERLMTLAREIEGEEKGASRRNDGNLAALLGLNPQDTKQSERGQPELFMGSGAGLGRREWLAPKFTGSIDTAMTLIAPSASSWNILAEALKRCSTATEDAAEQDFRRRLPSFVCAAAIRSIVEDRLAEQGK